MQKDNSSKKWYFKEAGAQSLDPLSVRDLMIECFYASQGDVFRKAKGNLGVSFSEEDIFQRAVSVVKAAFKKTGGDFQQPDREGLLRALDFLADTAASWGTPMDIIEHNVSEMSKAITLVK